MAGNAERKTIFEHIMYDACVPRLTVVHNHDAFKRIDVPYFDLFA